MTAFISPRSRGGRGPKPGPLNPHPSTPLGRGQACESSSRCWDPSGPQAPCSEPPNPSSLCIDLECVTLGRDLASLGLQAPLKGAGLRVGGRVQQMPGLGCRGQTQVGQGSVPKMLGLPELHTTPLGGGDKIGSQPLRQGTDNSVNSKLPCTEVASLTRSFTKVEALRPVPRAYTGTGGLCPPWTRGKGSPRGSRAVLGRLSISSRSQCCQAPPEGVLERHPGGPH